MHPRYNPERDGSPQQKDCPGCESLHVIHLYCYIARKKALSGEGILISRPDPPVQAQPEESPALDEKNQNDTPEAQVGKPKSDDSPRMP